MAGKEPETEFDLMEVGVEGNMMIIPAQEKPAILPLKTVGNTFVPYSIYYSGQKLLPHTHDTFTQLFVRYVSLNKM